MTTTAPAATRGRPFTGLFSRGLLDFGTAGRPVAAIWIALALMCALVLIVRPALLRPASLETILVLAAITIMVGLGQGAVIFIGGIDLSIPWTMSSSAILFAGITGGRSELLLPGLLAALALGVGVGLANGIGSIRFGVHPVVMTLAMNAVLQGATLGYTGGSVTGSPPAEAGWLMTGDLLGIAPILWVMLVLVLAVTLVLRSGTFGRRLNAVGLAPEAARLAGTSSARLSVLMYVLSSLCAVLAGIMLSGLASQSYLGMGDPYLLGSIAVVALGGAAFSGGRGHFLGTVGAGILLSLLTSLLTTYQLPEAVKQIAFGAVILVAIIAGTLRSRRRSPQKPLPTPAVPTFKGETR